MIKDGKDWHGLQKTNLKNLGLTFRDAQTMTLPQKDGGFCGRSGRDCIIHLTDGRVNLEKIPQRKWNYRGTVRGQNINLICNYFIALCEETTVGVVHPIVSVCPPEGQAKKLKVSLKLRLLTIFSLLCKLNWDNYFIYLHCYGADVSKTW